MGVTIRPRTSCLALMGHFIFARKLEIMKRKKMFALIEAWLESGQTIADFLADKQVRRSTFSYWRTKYRREKASFTDITPQSEDIGSSPSVELIYPSGVRVLIAQTDVSLIRALAQ